MEPVSETTIDALASVVPLDRAQPKASWRFLTRVAFRFVFVYFVLYSFPFPLDLLPFTSLLLGKYEALWNNVVPWVGSHVLHLAYPITVLPNGSGDTTYNYVQVLCFLILAITATSVWSVLDRNRSSYESLYRWFRLYIRLVLGATMIGYGAAKVIPTQMPPPGLSILTENYGDSSPMRLLWTFMGASKGYEAFAGGCEMVGGLLLFLPALATLGTLLLAGVLTNVFMLNMCYDVPVKLYSFHLLLMALFLLAPDFRGLGDIFIFRRRAELSRDVPLFRRKGANRLALALQVAFAFYLLTTTLYASHQRLKQASIEPPFYGIWSVREYAVEGEVPGSPADASHWKAVIFDFPERLTVQPLSGAPQRYFLKLDQQKKTMDIVKRIDPAWKTELVYENPQPDILSLRGQVDGHQVHVKAHRIDPSKFLLTSRGFHWINEYPYQQ